MAAPLRPLRLEAAILSRTRSPITSRSNWAKESTTEREPAHAGNGVERLGDRHERYPMLIRSRPVTALQSDLAPDTES